jgi:hypothetical protein
VKGTRRKPAKASRELSIDREMRSVNSQVRKSANRGANAPINTTRHMPPTVAVTAAAFDREVRGGLHTVGLDDPGGTTCPNCA